MRKKIFLENLSMKNNEYQISFCLISGYHQDGITGKFIQTYIAVLITPRNSWNIIFWLLLDEFSSDMIWLDFENLNRFTFIIDGWVFRKYGTIFYGPYNMAHIIWAIFRPEYDQWALRKLVLKGLLWNESGCDWSKTKMTVAWFACPIYIPRYLQIP